MVSKLYWHIKNWMLNILSLILKFLRSELGVDIYWLYSIHLVSYLFPLLLIPYLARILGVSGWGVLVFMLAASSFIALFIEFGFYVSAQREVARCREDANALSRLFNMVFSTKLLITVLVVIVFSFVSFFISNLNQDPKLFFGVLFFGVTQAFSFTWYFRGIKKIKIATAMEAVSKVIGTILVIFFIQSPLDFWKYFYAFGFSQTVVLVWGFWNISKTINIHLPNLSVALKGLKNGFSVFLLHVTGSFFTTGNVFLLGFLAPYQVVGYFAGAEKIVRFLANGMDPVRHAMFPRLSNLMMTNYKESRTQVIRTLYITGGFSLAISCLVCLFASTIISIILGDEFLEATGSLMLMSILIPILTLNAGLGFLWMIPRGFERSCVKIVLFALLLNIALALLTVPIFQHLGMALSVVISELIIAISFLVLFIRDKDQSVK